MSLGDAGERCTALFDRVHMPLAISDLAAFKLLHP
jgi:hypothetical protein